LPIRENSDNRLYHFLEYSAKIVLGPFAKKYPLDVTLYKENMHFPLENNKNATARRILSMKNDTIQKHKHAHPTTISS
jgi:hypothetical protein